MQSLSLFPARVFLAFALFFFAGTTLAGDYYSRRSGKKSPTGISEKSRKAIRKAMAGDGGRQNRGSGGAFARAKADTERYRLRQDEALALQLDEEGGEGMPDYRLRALEAYRQTGDRNMKRFAEAASEFQMQELREMALENIDDPEAFSRYMALISGRPHAPYSSVRDSGYVVNRSTGEISVGNPHAARMHDSRVKADTARKNAAAASQYARSRERTEKKAAGRKKGEGSAAATGLTAAEYRTARERAETAGRPELVEELDAMARSRGYIDQGTPAQ